MISVGVRQLKNGLTRYLRFVEEGQVVLVTNRDRPMAVLKKPELNAARSLEEKLAGLIAEGKLLPPVKSGHFRRFKPIRVKGKPVSTMIIEDRR